MDTKLLKKLEFETITNKLAFFCETDIGKEIATSLLPSFCFSDVEHKLEETNEACFLFNQLEKELHFYTFSTSLCIKKLGSGQFLNLKELLNVANLLRNSRVLKDIFLS